MLPFAVSVTLACPSNGLPLMSSTCTSTVAPRAVLGDPWECALLQPVATIKAISGIARDIRREFPIRNLWLVSLSIATFPRRRLRAKMAVPRCRKIYAVSQSISSKHPTACANRAESLWRIAFCATHGDVWPAFLAMLKCRNFNRFALSAQCAEQPRARSSDG
jgi:hypothetical protein